MLPIKMRNVGFIYHESMAESLSSEISATVKSKKQTHAPPKAASAPTSGKSPVKADQPTDDVPGIKNITIDVDQGSLVALIGQRGQGKTTLLKILGGVLIPEGEFYMPTHLRAIHVLQEPMFFETTLLENLRYGVRPGCDDGNIERVLCTCRSLMVSEAVIKLIIEDEVHPWNEHLSLTQKTSLHLARALIANPDVLMIHKPLLTFDSGTSKAVMETLRMYVTERGLFLDGDVKLRRRKTCIITATRVEGCSMADRVILVSKTGATSVEAHHVTVDMLH